MTPRSLRSQYTFGFVVSILLTGLAYWMVDQHLANGHFWPSDGAMLGWLTVIALAQFMAQLVLFLHVGQEAKPHWRLMTALFAALVVVVLVLGSIWIMDHLNYQMGTPSDTDAAIIKDEGLHQNHEGMHQ